MSNDIQKAGRHLPSINIKAEGRGTAVGYTDAINMNMNIIMTDGTRNSLACEYFNLIIGYDPFEKDYILVDRDRALTEYMSDEMKAEFGKLTHEVIDKIKKLPAIIAQEWDRTDEQQAIFAFIKDVKVQDNGVKIRYTKFFPIPFNFIRENLDELAVYLFEIYRTHWSIKHVDLLDVMQEKGLFPGK